MKFIAKSLDCLCASGRGVLSRAGFHGCDQPSHDGSLCATCDRSHLRLLLPAQHPDHERRTASGKINGGSDLWWPGLPRTAVGVLDRPHGGRSIGRPCRPPSLSRQLIRQYRHQQLNSARISGLRTGDPIKKMGNQCQFRLPPVDVPFDFVSHERSQRLQLSCVTAIWITSAMETGCIN